MKRFPSCFVSLLFIIGSLFATACASAKSFTDSRLFVNTEQSLCKKRIQLISNKEALSFSNLVKQANTIYEVRGIFNLNKETIYIPKGCTLRFVDGYLYNGKIVFQDTRLEQDSKSSICFSDMSFSGTIKNDYINSSILPNNEIQSLFNVLHDSDCTLVLNDSIFLTTSSSIPSIEGDGKVVFISRDILLENSNTLILKNLIIEDTYNSFSIVSGEQTIRTHAGSTALIKKSKGLLLVSNVVYQTPYDSIGKCLFSISNTKSARIENVRVKNAFGLCIMGSNTSDYVIDDIYIQNAILGIYCTTNFDKTTYNCRGIISNISFVNTKAFQSLGLSINKTNGFSCLLLEYGVDNISIKNVYCERAIERLAYIQSSNTTIHNVTAKNSGGIKLAGSWSEATQSVSGWITNTHVDEVSLTYDDPDITPVLLDSKLETYHSKNCSFSNVHFYGTPELNKMTEFIRMRSDVSGFVIENVQITGFSNASLLWGRNESQIIGVAPLHGKAILKDVTIRNIKAYDSFKGVKYFFGTLSPDSPEQIGEFRNVIIEDVIIDNPYNDLNVMYLCNKNTRNVSFKRIYTEHSFIKPTGDVFERNHKYSLLDYSDSVDRGIKLIDCVFKFYQNNTRSNISFEKEDIVSTLNYPYCSNVVIECTQNDSIGGIRFYFDRKKSSLPFNFALSEAEFSGYYEGGIIYLPIVGRVDQIDNSVMLNTVVADIEDNRGHFAKVTINHKKSISISTPYKQSDTNQPVSLYREDCFLGEKWPGVLLYFQMANDISYYRVRCRVL